MCIHLYVCRARVNHTNDDICIQNKKNSKEQHKGPNILKISFKRAVKQTTHKFDNTQILRINYLFLQIFWFNTKNDFLVTSIEQKKITKEE